MNYESRFFAQLYGLSIRFGRVALGNVRINVLSSDKTNDQIQVRTFPEINEIIVTDDKC